MCGRFAQYKIAWEYLDPIGLDVPLLSGVSPEPIGRYNVAPTSKVQIIHQNSDGLLLEPLPWGYAPFWAQGKRPPAINARVETAATSKFFRDIWLSGRCIVPADGWYEWVADPDNPKAKQPYYIRKADGGPLYFAAIGQFDRRGGMETKPGDGFAIITADSDEGMLDIHDRRPVVLSAECAAHWLDPELTPEEAADVVHEHAEPVEMFVWHQVGKEIGNVRNEGPGLIQRTPA
ncbi:SOS response-associated peptidase family protein [Pseudomonas sp. B392_1p]|uniref:SOS response-associated peptidase family protein n=1 Tax=Pseudomonas sp. B392_1p TaxID=3457507 RepID=UPI003FCFD34F